MHAKTAILVLFLWTISLQNAQLAHGDEALIARLCGATSYPKECTGCVETISGRDVSTDIAVVKSVLTCGARAISALYSDAYNTARSTTTPVLKDALTICLDHIEASQGLINVVADRVNNRDFNGAKGYTGQILTIVGVCNDAAKSKGAPLPGAVVNDLATVKRDWDGIVLKMLNVVH